MLHAVEARRGGEIPLAAQLWLGHAQMQTTEIYLRADPVEKIEIIEAVTPPSLRRRGRFTVPRQAHSVVLVQGLSSPATKSATQVSFSVKS